MANIVLDFSSLNDIVPVIHGLTRKELIEHRKQAIYQYRNQLLTQKLHTEIKSSDFAKTEFGKPYLSHFPDFNFNHSHSQQHYVLASSPKIANLGVDIEDLNRKVRFKQMAQHIFHPEEMKQWESIDFDPHYWFKVWTTKEAVLKASGLGIRLSLNELNTQCHATQNGGICHHPQLGVFAYQNIQLAQVMLTVAWSSSLNCKGFNFPKIELKFSP